MPGVLNWCYTISYTAFFGLLPYIYVTHKEYTLQLLLGGLVFHCIDFLISDSPWKNLQTAQKSGYSIGTIIFYTLLNIISYQFVWILFGQIILNEVKIVYYFDIWLLLKITITLITGDIYFYWAHKWLHQSEFGAQLHLLHHTCLHTSMSTALIFNPIDLLLEFTGPNAMLLIMYWIFNDPCFLVVTGTIMLVWYGMSHDECLEPISHHYKHHTDCNGDYPIYKEWRVYNPNDKIKRLIKR
eukprot:163831_1